VRGLARHRPASETRFSKHNEDAGTRTMKLVGLPRRLVRTITAMARLSADFGLACGDSSGLQRNSLSPGGPPDKFQRLLPHEALDATVAELIESMGRYVDRFEYLGSVITVYPASGGGNREVRVARAHLGARVVSPGKEKICLLFS